jgi:hypothetical protein
MIHAQFTIDQNLNVRRDFSIINPSKGVFLKYYGAEPCAEIPNQLGFKQV